MRWVRSLHWTFFEPKDQSIKTTITIPASTWQELIWLDRYSFVFSFTLILDFFTWGSSGFCHFVFGFAGSTILFFTESRLGVDLIVGRGLAVGFAASECESWVG